MLVVGLATSASAQGVQPPAPPGPPAPGSRALLPEDITLEYPGDVYQAIHVSGAQRRGITILWRYKPSLPGGVDLSTKEEHFSTSFVPTAYAVVSPPMADVAPNGTTSTLRLFVAGRGDRGHTIVEEWQFERNDVNGPSATAVIDSQAGVTTYKWRVPARSLTKELLRTDLASHDTVMWMMPNRGDPSVVLLQFWASRDVYALRVTDGTLTLLASASGGSSALFVNPNLASRFSTYWAADRVDMGFVYVLGCSGWSTPIDVQAVVFVDSDRDGAIDHCRELSSALWAQEAWQDTSKYTRYFP
ncbi:MAG: hypothetical protein JNK02_02285 [Planctomycetes bacterium]|nr:hypothetical protein [Planctomycetota bacterium]